MQKIKIISKCYRCSVGPEFVNLWLYTESWIRYHRHVFVFFHQYKVNFHSEYKLELRIWESVNNNNIFAMNRCTAYYALPRTRLNLESTALFSLVQLLGMDFPWSFIISLISKCSSNVPSCIIWLLIVQRSWTFREASYKYDIDWLIERLCCSRITNTTPPSQQQY